MQTGSEGLLRREWDLFYSVLDQVRTLTSSTLCAQENKQSDKLVQSSKRVFVVLFLLYVKYQMVMNILYRSQGDHKFPPFGKKCVQCNRSLSGTS